DQQKHVVLIKTRETRRDYQAAVLPPAGSIEAETDGQVQRAAAEAPAVRRSQTAESRVQQAVHEPAAEDAAGKDTFKRSAPAAKRDSEPRTAETPETTLTAVRLKSRDAVSVSKNMYKALKSQAELVEDGPRGLEGFRVFRQDFDKYGKPIDRGVNRA